MSEETNNGQRWLPWAVALTATVGILLAVEFLDWPNIFVAPWILVKGLFTIQALDAFEGITPLEAVSLNDQLRIVAAILLLYIAGPVCWIMGEIRSQKEHIKFKSLIWYVGVILVGIGLFSATYGTTDRFIRFQNNAEQIKVDSAIDELRSDLRKIARKAVELYYLPSNKGGGSQSFQAFEDSAGTKRSIQLSDLSNHISTDNTLVLKEVQSDSSITIYGISNVKGKDPDFKNANGEQGLLQLAINVHPEDGFYDFNYKESNTRFR